MKINNIKSLLLFILLLPYPSFGQSAFSYIDLTWNDFTKKDLKHEVYEARIGVFHNCEMGYLVQNNTVEITLISKIQIDKAQSYVDKNFVKTATKEASQDLLDHEKGHLLITLYHHFRLIDLFKEYKFTQNYKEEMRQLIQQVTQQKEEMNALYDKETHHHINTRQQAEWNSKINDLIKPYLSQYNNYYNLEVKKSISL